MGAFFFCFVFVGSESPHKVNPYPSGSSLVLSFKKEQEKHN